MADADMLIAKYNVNRYLAGRTEELDLSYFDELSDASVTALLPVAQADGKEPFKENAQARITRFLSQYENTPVLERSLVDMLAYHSAKTKADGFLKSDLKVTVTVQFPSYYEIQSVELYGESFSEGVQNADGSPITEEQPVFTFTPDVYKRQAKHGVKVSFFIGTGKRNGQKPRDNALHGDEFIMQELHLEIESICLYFILELPHYNMADHIKTSFGSGVFLPV